MLATYLAPVLARRGIHYGWVIAAVAFVVMLSTAAAMSLPSVMLLPVQGEFGWSTVSISGALALRLMLFGFMGPFAAALLLRYGIRTVVSAALLMIAAGLCVSTLVTQAWMLWATWGVVLGLSSGMTATVLGATVASRWFVKQRGLVVGMLTASSATGQLLILPLAAWLCDHWGWRLAIVPALVACGIAGVLVLLFGRSDPSELGLAAYGDTGPAAAIARPTQNPVRAAFGALKLAAGVPVFWILFGTFFVCGLSTNGLVQVHFIPLCHDFGMGETEAASVLATMGVFDFVGTIASGWLSDRYDNRWLLFWYYGLRGLSLVVLPFLNFSFFGLALFAMFYGLDWIATVPPTVKLASKQFGRDRGPMVFGWVFTGHQIGAATAALLAGVSRDALSSYLPAFYGAGVACIAAAVAILFVQAGRQPQTALAGAD